MRFEALEVSLSLIRSLRGPVGRLRVADPDLYRQIRRAGSSIALNLAEGSARNGKDQKHHYRIARGSAKEVQVALRSAEAWGDLKPNELRASLEVLDRLLGLLWGLTH